MEKSKKSQESCKKNHTLATLTLSKTDDHIFIKKDISEVLKIIEDNI